MIEDENKDNIEYKEKDIVWAKVKGYPWWPSIINNISHNIQTIGENNNEKMYTIELIGEKNITKVSKEKIEPFNKNYEEHINTKNISLLKSIELANDIYDKKPNSEILYLKENTQDKKNKKEKNNQNNSNLSSKKSHESSEVHSDREKESEKNIKYLQKKRINEKVILDNDNDINDDEENDNLWKDENKTKEDKKKISAPKNNIKINININLNTNNQNTVNINSFYPHDVLSQNNNSKQKNIISNNNFNSINYSSLTCNEKTNKNNNNNLNKILNLDEESIISSIEREKEKNKNENINNLKNDKNENEKEKNNSVEEFEEEHESDEENDNDELFITKDIINEITQKLLNCQIQMSNISSQKVINTELIKLSEKLDELFSKNQNSNNSQDIEIYKLTKDLIPILITFTYNKNNDIVIKSSEILSLLNEKIIKEIFILSPKEQKLLIDSLNYNIDKYKKISQIDIDENDFKEGQNIVDMINQRNLAKNNFSDHTHISFSKRGRPKKISMNSEISSDLFSNKVNESNYNNLFNFGEKNIYDEFLKLISCTDKNKMENDFKELSGNFFDNIYDKNNVDLDYDTAKLRKDFCKKLFQMVHKLYPKINIELLREIIKYFEYKIRNDSTNLDKIYFNKIKSSFEIIKEKLNDKTK